MSLTLDRSSSSSTCKASADLPFLAALILRVWCHISEAIQVSRCESLSMPMTFWCSVDGSAA